MLRQFTALRWITGTCIRTLSDDGFWGNDAEHSKKRSKASKQNVVHRAPVKYKLNTVEEEETGFGIFTKEKVESAPPPTPAPFKTQREISQDKEKLFHRLADAEDYGDEIPKECMFTKELQHRRLGNKPKLLEYPIDNQRIVWEESTVPFTEHLSLHSYLSLFPERTREFMTTVISALQHNPDLTVGKKKEIIQGYLNYFNYHKDLLVDVDENIIEV